MSNIKHNGVLTVLAVMLFTAASYGNPSVSKASSADISGIYSGKTAIYRFPGPTTSKPTAVFGAVNSKGNGYFILASAKSSDIKLFENLKGMGRITSPERDVPIEGRAVARGAQNWQVDIKPGGAGGNASMLTGSAMFGDGHVSLDLQRQAVTDQQISLDRRGGTYQGVDINRRTKVIITLDSAGNFTGTDDRGCSISGNLVQVNRLNLFDTHIAISGAADCRSKMTGVAFFDIQDRTGQLSGATGSYLYLIGANPNFSHGFAMVLLYQRK